MTVMTPEILNFVDLFKRQKTKYTNNKTLQNIIIRQKKLVNHKLSAIIWQKYFSSGGNF